MVRTSHVDLGFTTATANAMHKLDVDPVEDGCFSSTVFNLRVSPSGCTLRLEFGPEAGVAGGLKSATLNADSFCPGFLDAREGVYETLPGYGPWWWSGPGNAGRQAQTACLTGARLTFPDRDLPLTRSDGETLTINLKDLVLSGALFSRGDPTLRCVSSTCGSGHLLGADGWCRELTWTPMASGTAEKLNDLWGSGQRDVWAVGDHGALQHFDGTRWSPTPPLTPYTLKSVWGSGPDDVWAVGVESLHRTSTGWAVASTGSTQILTGVWGTGPNDVWIVGWSGTTRHWDGALWSEVNSGVSANLLAVWGSGPSDVWAVGAAGTIRHWDGTGWAGVASPTVRNLTSIWGSGPQDVWAVGDAGAVIHWNGLLWANVAPPANLGSTYFRSVWGTGPGNVWAAGISLMNWDGAGWTAQSATSRWIDKVWGTGPDDVWGLSQPGTIMHLH